ncbi:PhoH family protein [Neobacillus sp. YIM B02564]|uniref:PhoH family protein n=1 Tax=Neobacillus paridis TaxID=2803862 RepID=A0ABS1TM63_9BACI|nr:PhoH family protein [Neobacillus paridis]MBL4951000.1 PhoH family protein [Neobacillus paridis]
MDKLYLIDTNVLLESPEVIKEYNVVISGLVLRELEKHKLSYNKELAFNARIATRFINENVDNLIFDLKDYQVTFDESLDKDYTDNKILQSCLDNSYSLITNDLLLKLKAKGLNIEVISPKDNDDLDYKGYKFVDLSDSEIAYFYEHINENIYNLYINQYLIIRDLTKNTIDKYRWNGKEHIKLKIPPKKFIRPENDLQECALDLLNDTSIPIKIIAGNFGSGKTFLAVKMAIYHINEKGNYAKLMVVRNPIGTGESIGWLKGTKEDKTDDFFVPVIQNLDGGEFEADKMIQSGKLLKNIPFFMKGITVDDSFMLVDEAEDLDVKLIKTIGTRLGKNACVAFSGDYQQSEDKFIYNNGLVTAIDKLKGNPLVGIIVLDRDVRSEASKVFADL